jgi:hypothetical protein
MSLRYRREDALWSGDAERPVQAALDHGRGFLGSPVLDWHRPLRGELCPVAVCLHDAPEREFTGFIEHERAAPAG